jgi:2-methylisocitrate lyase-like PEP mutase family enzyme
MIDAPALRRKADALRALHRPGQPIVLANVWDSGGARVLEAAGAPAIATTSAGIAFSRGYPDGERIPRDEMLAEVARIAGSVSVPVTADLESGYGTGPEALERLADDALEAGAVGLNLEDHVGPREAPLVDLAVELEKLRALRESSARRGVPLVINARTDAFLRGLGSPSEMLDETIRRGRAYRDGGADCVFVPGVTDSVVIGRLVREIEAPINVLAVSGSPPIADLARLGVARVSLGSGPARAALTLLERIARELSTDGTYSALEGIYTHARINEIMEAGLTRKPLPISKL